MFMSDDKTNQLVGLNLNSNMRVLSLQELPRSNKLCPKNLEKETANFETQRNNIFE